MPLADTTLPAGEPARRKPLPLEFPGVHCIDEQELDIIAAFGKVLRGNL